MGERLPVQSLGEGVSPYALVVVRATDWVSLAAHTELSGRGRTHQAERS